MSWGDVERICRRLVTSPCCLPADILARPLTAVFGSKPDGHSRLARALSICSGVSCQSSLHLDSGCRFYESVSVSVFVSVNPPRRFPSSEVEAQRDGDALSVDFDKLASIPSRYELGTAQVPSCTCTTDDFSENLHCRLSRPGVFLGIGCGLQLGCSCKFGRPTWVVRQINRES